MKVEGRSSSFWRFSIFKILDGDEKRVLKTNYMCSNFSLIPWFQDSKYSVFYSDFLETTPFTYLNKIDVQIELLIATLPIVLLYSIFLLLTSLIKSAKEICFSMVLLRRTGKIFSKNVYSEMKGNTSVYISVNIESGENPIRTEPLHILCKSQTQNKLSEFHKTNTKQHATFVMLFIIDVKL